ncbi:pilus assembly protein [Rhizobium sp. CG4]|jgi:Flp pilus assembly protein TadG|uniref:TadE/TadG family type IV pilus assembly protein n=1 Tax=Rhizobium/Agrobacterium group TaxID=227290 RepID=UPI00177E5A53|nr:MULTISPECIES: TadE/TadG family type IV pilus assembly protein [Rhizobium/Agrobacterium group]MBD9386776.1 pilus assembly protein [Agrobacterium sp. AGB01]MCM2455089.1 pilus assembly protein [Rhizobium sp. CG4]MCS4241383.1 Flp pilus assembly protein TadG [Rhizobium sp. BIGb0125]MDO5895341.1 pilus assembly protein [Agrobacterium sp. Azo12]
MHSIRSVLRDKSGASAVEFAIIAPMFILILLSLIAYGIYLTAAYAVQQVAADAARTAVAGLNTKERETLATDFVKKSTLNYAFLDKNAFTVAVASDPSNPNQFTVTIEYDARGLPIWNLYTYALPEKSIKRFSTIRIGGV